MSLRQACAKSKPATTKIYLRYQRIIDQSDLILTVFDSGASAAGPAEEKALAYALVSRKPVLNLDPYTLAVSRIDKRADK